MGEETVLLYLFVKNFKADSPALKYPFINKSFKELDKTKPYLHYFSVLIVIGQINLAS